MLYKRQGEAEYDEADELNVNKLNKMSSWLTSLLNLSCRTKFSLLRG